MIDNVDFINGTSVVKRDYELEPSGNYVITGIRRGGKSFLLISELKKELAKNDIKFVYLNFEDERLLPFKTENFQDILDSYYRKFPAFKNQH